MNIQNDLTGVTEGFKKGNIFKNLYWPYQKQTYNFVPKNDRQKKLIEIMENCWMMRNLYGPQELTPGDKYYLNPFRRVKNKQTGQWEKEQFLIISTL